MQEGHLPVFVPNCLSCSLAFWVGFLRRTTAHVLRTEHLRFERPQDDGLCNSGSTTMSKAACLYVVLADVPNNSLKTIVWADALLRQHVRVLVNINIGVEMTFTSENHSETPV